MNLAKFLISILTRPRTKLVTCYETHYYKVYNIYYQLILQVDYWIDPLHKYNTKLTPPPLGGRGHNYWLLNNVNENKNKNPSQEWGVHCGSSSSSSSPPRRRRRCPPVVVVGPPSSSLSPRHRRCPPVPLVVVVVLPLFVVVVPSSRLPSLVVVIVIVVVVIVFSGPRCLATTQPPHEQRLVAVAGVAPVRRCL